MSDIAAMLYYLRYSYDSPQMVCFTGEVLAMPTFGCLLVLKARSVEMIKCNCAIDLMRTPTTVTL